MKFLASLVLFIFVMNGFISNKTQYKLNSDEIEKSLEKDLENQKGENEETSEEDADPYHPLFSIKFSINIDQNVKLQFLQSSTQKSIVFNKIPFIPPEV